MKIICSKENYNKLRGCFKKGLCPINTDDDPDYCYDECIYNKDNIEFKETEGNTIELQGFNIDDSDFVCYNNTFYNPPKCGEGKTTEDCNKCKFYYENIKGLD